MFIAAFTAVLFAEIVGDKTVYTVTSLTSRFHAFAVMAGISAAFALKMLVAVLAGSVITTLPPSAVAAASCLGFLFAAWNLSRTQHEDVIETRNGIGVAFMSIAMTEWGDPGQIVAAVLTARYAAPLIVWAAGTAALLTKGLAAIAIGTAARRHIRVAWFRAVAAGACAVMAGLSAFEAVRAFGR